MGSDQTFAASRSNVRSTFLPDIALRTPLTAEEIAPDCGEDHNFGEANLYGGCGKNAWRDQSEKKAFPKRAAANPSANLHHFLNSRQNCLLRHEIASRRVLACLVFVLSHMGLQWPHICSAHPDQLSHLAKLADVSLSQLVRWSGPLISPCRYQVGDDIASTGVFRRAVTRICPRCVLESQADGLHAGPFQRIDWLVLSIHVCAEHGTALLKLPNARHTHDTYDLLNQIERYQCIIQRAADAGEPVSSTQFEAYVLSRIQGRAPQDWLSKLELQHLHRACLTLGAALLFGSTVNSAALDFERSRAALNRGYSALQGGPEPLLAALSELRLAYHTERPYFSTDMGDFYTWLKEEVEEPKLDDLRQTARAFIVDNYPLRPGAVILGSGTPKAKRMTFADAREVSGIARAKMATTLGHLRAASLATVSLTRSKASISDGFYTGR